MPPGCVSATAGSPGCGILRQGHVKEGVGAGGLTLLAQWRGLPLSRLVMACDRAVDQLLAHGQHGKAAP